ncbi:hypothetical protein CYMTET_49161 [Cymbomonas tetramitiformis]|nr:hypothetical protein CYMTET_49161 [Cymbomonas tetramitiformis]
MTLIASRDRGLYNRYNELTRVQKRAWSRLRFCASDVMNVTLAMIDGYSEAHAPVIAARVMANVYHVKLVSRHIDNHPTDTITQMHTLTRNLICVESMQQGQNS